MTERDERVAAAFSKLFRTYDRPAQELTEQAVREKVDRAKVYFEAVASYDAGDVETAVGNFLAGSAPGHNPSFAPPAPLVGAETRRVMNLRLDQANRDRALRPKLPPPPAVKTPESIAKFKAMLAEVDRNLAAMSLTDDAERERTRQDMQRKTDERFAPDMSPEAVRARLNPHKPFYSVGDEDVA